MRLCDLWRTGLWAISLSVLLPACGLTSTHQIAKVPSNASQWLVQHPDSHTAIIKLAAGEHNGMNFNGYGHGQMVITVPLHWNITVDFVNVDLAQAHSAMVVPLADHSLTSIPSSVLAFPKASTPSPDDGTEAGIDQSFHFVASHAGDYALCCGVPGHSAMGMWDSFIVSKTASKAAITITRVG